MTRHVANMGGRQFGRTLEQDRRILAALRAGRNLTVACQSPEVADSTFDRLREKIRKDSGLIEESSMRARRTVLVYAPRGERATLQVMARSGDWLVTK